eukprot:TRINITY_DN1229_c0_g1_i13.p1 TRINITY_DN1229_c0_g1~~TRINITY_DN1229_c0_g1_i13.p1  ORF type:complete len:593 (-),score=81.38 TRINITY_DN1229_c0_g1_i13:67-1845(-)
MNKTLHQIDHHRNFSQALPPLKKKFTIKTTAIQSHSCCTYKNKIFYSPIHSNKFKCLRIEVVRRSRQRKSLVIRNCGIVGIFKQNGEASVELYEALLMLQHRGQDSAGMVTTDWKQIFREHKDNGLVKDVFKADVMDRMKGNAGIAHVRYPTAGSSSAKEAQPFFVNSPLGIWLIHNGNLTNVEELRSILNSQASFYNRMLRTRSDSEVLLNIFADEIHRAHAANSSHQTCASSQNQPSFDSKLKLVLEAGNAVMRVLKGAYSCICLVNGVGLVAFRDPYGIRPLVLGVRETANGNEYCVASEDCAFGPIGFKRVRDVRPGELIVITLDGQLVSQQCCPGRLTPCVFEYIYLARPDSVLNDIPVYSFQLELGVRLAKRIREKNWDIDIIVPVPDGSRPSAIQISSELKLPYREGLVKNRYVGRTFIMPDQQVRELSVRRKLNAMSAVFEDKQVLLVDDSIVRGTTMSQIVDMVRRAGAKKVYLASASPPVKYPNVYGVDLPSKKEFVAHGLSVDEVCQTLGADGLVYQTVDDLLSVGNQLNPTIKNFEASCFTCKYVTGDIDDVFLQELEIEGRGKEREYTVNNVSKLMVAK